MKVLVVGGGGREHALVWGLVRGPRGGAAVEARCEVVCAPGNAGIAALARCVPLEVTDVAATVRLAERERPGLVVIGPEVPLALGVVDALTERGFRVFGPTATAAKLESSKGFSKSFMQRHEIATAAYALCTSMDDVSREMREFAAPVVVKADGLAAGKGVVICRTLAEAEAAAAAMFSGELLGSVVEEIVIEEFLAGEELSFFALCDGMRAVPIAAAQDHKRVGEGDTGPNTGGMGAYSTDYLLGAPMRAWLTENVAQRVVDGMREEGASFRGVLFCGMMLVPRGDGTVEPMVLEFNTRWGDPETEAIVLRLETPLLELLEAAVDGIQEEFAVRLRPEASVAVIAASGGYPGSYAKGEVISGLEDVPEEVVVFHAGTAERDGEIVTAGGRVLAVSAASAMGLADALGRVYGAMEGIGFKGMQYRRDIGWRALKSGR